MLGKLSLIIALTLLSAPLASAPASAEDSYFPGPCMDRLAKSCYHDALEYFHRPGAKLSRSFQGWPRKDLYALALVNGLFNGSHYPEDDLPAAAWLDREIAKVIGPPPVDPDAARPLPPTRRQREHQAAETEHVCPPLQARSDPCPAVNDQPLCVAYQDDPILRQWPPDDRDRYICYLHRSIHQCDAAQALPLLQSLPEQILRDYAHDCRRGALLDGTGQNWQARESGLLSEALGIQGHRRQAVGLLGESVDSGSGAITYIFYPDGGLPPMVVTIATSAVDLVPGYAKTQAEDDRKLRLYYAYGGAFWNGYPRYTVSRMEPARP